jgi:hypothetical protein
VIDGYLRPRLGIDPRALAAFRISLGLLVLVDLFVYRASGLVTFYSDAGVFPRSALQEVYPSFASLSLHAISGSPWLQITLFAVNGVVAFCLVFGYRSRLAALLTFVLLTSLHARNPHVINGGNMILLSLLLYGIALPLGSRWSVDARRRERAETRDRVLSVATAAILVHFVSIYAINAVLKYQSEPWMTGTAIQQIFRLHEFTTILGAALAEASTLLALTTWSWVVLLTASPLLVLFTGRLRLALVAAFVSAQLGLAATVWLGIFPFVMIAALLLFAPPLAWDRLERAVSRTGLSSAIERSYERAAGTLSRAAPSVPTVSAPVPARSPRVRRGTRTAGSVLVVCILVAFLSWQAIGAEFVEPAGLDEDGELTNGSWTFFAPNPPDSTGWFVVEATLESGETIDPIAAGDAGFDRPPNAEDPYPTTLWKQYGIDLQHADDTHYEPAAAYLCERLDDAETVTIHHAEQPVDADGPAGDPVSNERITHGC